MRELRRLVREFRGHRELKESMGKHIGSLKNL